MAVVYDTPKYLANLIGAGLVFVGFVFGMNLILILIGVAILAWVAFSK